METFYTHPLSFNRNIMHKSPTTEMFFELIRLGIGTSDKFNYTPTESEWQELFELSRKQALTGIAFSGIEKLVAAQLPPKQLLLNWHNYCTQIKLQNYKLDKLAAKVCENFEKEGFRNSILKGQGVAQLYEQPTRRIPGDIDIWLEGGNKKILDYVKRFVPNCRPVYHHVDFLKLENVDIEVHFTPTWMNSYFTNKKLQRFFEKESNAQFTHKVTLSNGERISAPTNIFNRIYILLHIYRHLFQEGIGLRQLLDYYYVLKQGFTKEEKEATLEQLKEFKMLRFTGATMYVLKRVFNIDDAYLLTSPLEKEGAFLLEEILEAGNFGKYSSRYKNEMSNSLIKRAISKSAHHFLFIGSYPSETLWGPLFRTWHYFYKKRLISKL